MFSPPYFFILQQISSIMSITFFHIFSSIFSVLIINKNVCFSYVLIAMLNFVLRMGFAATPSSKKHMSAKIKKRIIMRIFVFYITIHIPFSM